MFNTLKKQVNRCILILYDPKQSFHELEKESLEEVTSYYMQMLLFAGAATGLFNLMFLLSKTLYLDFIVDIDVRYSIVFNYLVGRATSLVFFYIFGGTILLFFLSMIIRIFIRLRYAELLKLLMYSIAPLLLFGWIVGFQAIAVIWCIFLFVIGLKTYTVKSIKKDTISNRN
ncbi:hypothetical protein J4206_01820 [Candidatus Woesearchaeota archaeon]|nr:hypothetical protein [Candidatus Woesearchaeota archaeon]